MIEQQNDRKPWYEDNGDGTPVFCAIIIFLSNIITALCGAISRCQSIWDVLGSFLACILYLLILFVPVMAILAMMYNIIYGLINFNIQNVGIEFNIGKYKCFVSIFEILGGTIIMIILYFVMQKVFGISIFNLYSAMN